jgi:hypothetical protein
MLDTLLSPYFIAQNFRFGIRLTDGQPGAQISC